MGINSGDGDGLIGLYGLVFRSRSNRDSGQRRNYRRIEVNGGRLPIYPGIDPRQPVNSDNSRNGGVKRSDKKTVDMRRATRNSDWKIYKPLDKTSRSQVAVEETKLFWVRQGESRNGYGFNKIGVNKRVGRAGVK